MESFPQQKIMSFLLAFFMLVLAVSTIYCVIRLQERTLQVQSLQGQRTALQAQVKDWQEKCNKLPEDQQSGEGLMMKKMGVSLVSPAADAEITDSVLVQGYANVFEGTVNLRLKDAAGRILTADLAMACMGDWPCYFEKELKFTQPEADTDAVLEAYTISAKDSSEQDLISVQLKIKGRHKQQSAAVSSCGQDSDCGWLSTNCCPENSGAFWECLNLTATQLDCLEPLVCLAVISPKPIVRCQCISGICQTEDLVLARQVLVQYFALLNEKNYTAAAEYYEFSDDWILEAYGVTNVADFLESRCVAGGYQCLKVREIISEKVISNDEFEFVVQFTNEQGDLFVSGPCCGATPEQDPPNSDFVYAVKKDNQGNFLVDQLPPYIP